MRASRLSSKSKSGSLPNGGSRLRKHDGFMASVFARFRRHDEPAHSSENAASIISPDAFDALHPDAPPASAAPGSPPQRPNGRATMRDMGGKGGTWTSLRARRADPSMSMGISHAKRHRRPTSPRSVGPQDDTALPVFTGWVRHYSSYGTNFAMDLFSLLHNSARREFVDMYCILSSMAKRERGLSPDDLRAFFNWFKVFESFLVQMLQIEEEIVIRWVASFQELPQDLEDSERRHLRGGVYETLNTIGDLRGLVARESVYDIITALIEAGDSLAEKLLAWFDLLETSLPPIISDCCTPEEKAEVELQVADGFLRGENPQTALPMLVRWMEDPDLIHYWTFTNIAGAKSRRAITGWSKAFRERHVSYPVMMYDLLLKHQRAVHSADVSTLTPPTV